MIRGCLSTDSPSSTSFKENSVKKNDALNICGMAIQDVGMDVPILVILG